MKTLFAIIALLFSTSVFANDTLLTCSLQAEASRDLIQIKVTQTNQGLELTQTSRNGASVVSALSSSEWASKSIRLSNDRGGFRWLRHQYSEFFNEFDWFVITQGAGFSSTARANCR